MRPLLAIALIPSVVFVAIVWVIRRNGRRSQPQVTDREPIMASPAATRAMEDPPPGSAAHRERADSEHAT